MMKVETNLKAGSVLDSAVNTTNQAASQVSSFFSKAGQQAQGITSGVSNTTSCAWKCLGG